MALLGSSGAALYWEYELKDDDDDEVRPPPRGPQARLSLSTDDVRVGDEITLNASQSEPGDHPIAEYRWDFGDGNVAATTIANVNHTWDDNGTFRVSVTVADEADLTSNTTVNITVRHPDYHDEWSGNGQCIGGGGLTRNHGVAVKSSAGMLEIEMVFEPEDISVHFNVTITLTEPDDQVIYSESKDSYLQEVITFTMSFSDDEYSMKDGQYNVEMMISSDNTNAGAFQYTGVADVTY